MEIMKEIKEIVDPKHTALIIIDPQHDFCSSEGAMSKTLGLDMSRIQSAVPKLNKLIEKCREAGVQIVWINEIFANDKMLPNQKAIWGGGEDIWLIKENSPGIEWYDKMIEPQADEPIITKWQYDAFEDTALHLLLQSKGIKTILMTGFTSNVCVETTARHGYMKGYYIVFVSDCSDAPTKAEHEAVVFNIQTYFGKVVTGEEVATYWE